MLLNASNKDSALEVSVR